MKSLCQKILIFIFFSVTSTNAFAQESFFVLYVKGEILHDSTNIKLKENDILTGNLKFKFTSEESYAKLLSNERGEMYLVSNINKYNKKSEWVVYLEDNILPKMQYFATRSDEDSSIKLFFKNNKLYKNKYIKVSYIPKDSLSHYSLEFNINDKKYCNKLVIDKEGNIIINHDTFNLNDDPIDLEKLQNIGINYYNKKTKRITNLKGVSFKIVDLNVVSETVKYYRNILKKKSLTKTEINTTLLEFLNETYGLEIDITDFENE